MTQTVLIVDDEPSQLQLTQRAIEHKLRLHSVTAHGGAEAIEYLRTQKLPKPDLVLLDLCMPGVNGMQVIQAIRPLFPRLPIIVLTMYGDMEKAVAAVEAGANDFLAKPVTIERLRVTVNNMLKLSALEERARMNGNGVAHHTPVPPAPLELVHPPVVDGMLSAYDLHGNLRTLAYIERTMIDLALAHHRGCMARAARSLGIGRSTLYRKLEEAQSPTVMPLRPDGQASRFIQA